MVRNLKVIGTLVALLLIILVVSATTLTAAPVSQGATLVSSPPAAPEEQRAWTAERMQKAAPYPMPSPGGARGECAPAAPTGPASVIPGSDGSVDWSPTQPQVVTGAAGGNQTLGYGYPPPYTRYELFPVSMYRTYPNRTVGVLFFTQNGLDYRCSAASIGNYAIWAAGHCVSDGAGHWSTNFLFIPGYKDGLPIRPAWIWTGDKAWTFTGWHASGILCWDSGGVVLHLNSEGRKISRAVGNLGFAWNWPRDMHWFEIGYPAEAPFNGNRQFLCASSHSRDDNPGCASGVPTVGTGCDQTRGCSGGPWIMSFGSGNYVNGNFSYHYVGLEKEKFSPYFDGNSYNLYSALVGDNNP